MQGRSFWVGGAGVAVGGASWVGRWVAVVVCEGGQVVAAANYELHEQALKILEQAAND